MVYYQCTLSYNKKMYYVCHPPAISTVFLINEHLKSKEIKQHLPAFILFLTVVLSGARSTRKLVEIHNI